MLAFNAAVKVISRVEGAEKVFKQNNHTYEYDVYEVQAGNTIIYGLFDRRCSVEVGQAIQSSEVYLTSYDEEHSPVRLALRFGKFTVVDESEVDDVLVVKCNGKVYKPKDDRIRYSGVTRKPSYPCTISVKKECGGYFTVLLIGVHKKASLLKDLPADSYIDCTAKLYPKAIDDGYELNLVDFVVR